MDGGNLALSIFLGRDWWILPSDIFKLVVREKARRSKEASKRLYDKLLRNEHDDMTVI